MADLAVPRHPSGRCSPHKRTSQSGTRSHPDSVISGNSTPPASPERTAEYWDRCVEKLEEKRRLRRAAAENSPEGKPLTPRQTNRMVLDIISSYSDDSSYLAPGTSLHNHPSFDFGFHHERDRADSAHDIETIAQALELFPKPLSTTKSKHNHSSRPTSSIKVQGLRKEGQTLASPVPAKTSPKQQGSESSKKPRKCPPRPPRPEETFFIGLPLTPSPHPNRVVPKPTAQQERRSVAPPNVKVVRSDTTPPFSCKSTPVLPNLEPQPPIQCVESTPPTTPVRDASFALQQQLISVWEDDDDDDEDKKGLMEYVRRTLHASKTSFSADREKDAKERERGKERRKGSMDSTSSSEKRPSGDRRRRSTVRQAMVRVFRCGDSKDERS
ncbi:hypothetical protein MPH_11004 [Macrophomina phaseolina MS6]|uniref:Uncharacterized protein n=2 Tax=Macrophomina phaseolina TaxID=35725 RepID=K2RG33_MACPH|nr:hypothetical protein MPH_11004 [Macrophomina phaseolina MS6]KAH7057400.1 hypothetical protein B0J12DRAFT_697255 [Macrophomina phaseolina]